MVEGIGFEPMDPVLDLEFSKLLHSASSANLPVFYLIVFTNVFASSACPTNTELIPAAVDIYEVVPS